MSVVRKVPDVVSAVADLRRQVDQLRGLLRRLPAGAVVGDKGWVRLGPFLACWGSVTVGANSNPATFTFPVEFASAPEVWTSPMSSGAKYSTWASPSTSQVSVYHWTGTSAPTTNTGVRVLAIGLPA